MSRAVTIAEYKAVSFSDGLPRHLTAKIIGNQVVFSGGDEKEVVLPATIKVRHINAEWALYCANNDCSDQAKPKSISALEYDMAKRFANGSMPSPKGIAW